MSGYTSPKAVNGVIDNPRYVAWAHTNGRSPIGQLRFDRENWPGGSMCGFVLWNKARIAEFSRIRPSAYFLGRLIDHAAYDRWLNTVPVGHGLHRP